MLFLTGPNQKVFEDGKTLQKKWKLELKLYIFLHFHFFGRDFAILKHLELFWWDQSKKAPRMLACGLVYDMQDKISRLFLTCENAVIQEWMKKVSL